ncbi:MAG: MlaD family protein [Polyangiales bacterium]
MNKQVKVGIFVVIGLIVGGFLIFLVGSERHMFSRRATLRAAFPDVQGLKEGSPVRMGGVDIGEVSSVDFGDNPSDPRVHVRFSIVAAHLRRIRLGDSRARIVAKGLLGDKALEVTIGSQGRVAHDGDSLTAGTEADLFQRADRISAQAQGVVDDVARVTRSLADQHAGESTARTLANLDRISTWAAQENGFLQRFLTDPRAADEINQTLAAVRRTADHASSTMANVDALTREARSGRGMVHALLFDPAGAELVRNASQATGELAGITRDVRTGNGGLHQIIYGTESAQAVRNLEQTTAQLRDLMTDVRAGRGTIGALLTDPSLYEDLKTLVGNVQRNEVLRALVRYSIHQDDSGRPPVNATPPASAPAQQR